MDGRTDPNYRKASLFYAIKPEITLNTKSIFFLDFKIQNMVGSCDVKFPIRLEGNWFIIFK